MKRITIGRSAANDVVLGDPTVSRRHAELRAGDGERYFLVDLDSTNGTFVRDGGGWVRIRQGYVCGGERLQFGEVVTTLETLLAGGPADGGPAPADAAEADDAIDETPPPEPAGAEPDDAADDRHASADTEPARRWKVAALAAASVVLAGAIAFAAYEFWDDTLAGMLGRAAPPPAALDDAG